MIVADSNALVKMVVAEEFSEVVRGEFGRQIAAGDFILVPDIALSESINALWKYLVLKKSIDRISFDRAVGNLMEIWKRLMVIGSSEVMEEAAKIASDTRLTIYDSVYFAVSRMSDAPLLTFDKEMRDKAEAAGIAVI